MKLWIESLVLWPADSRNLIHQLPLEQGKINVVHGRSGTGKSSIIAIIDYCLGASKCAIPVGVIRESVAWFGLVLNVAESRVLVARRTPGNRQASSDFYLAPVEGTVPQALTVTHSEQKFKQAFNNLVRLTNAPLSGSEEIGQFEGRPSYRDLAAFNFLPQHIVANPNTLFFKADSYEHKERLKRVMPFALGIIDGEYVVRERERNLLQRQRDDLVKRQDAHRRAMTSWDAEVERLWLSAVELGLATEVDDGTTQARLETFRNIHGRFQSGALNDVLKSPNHGFTNQKYKEAQEHEERLQRAVDDLRRDIRRYEGLSKRATQFKDAVQLERSRVVNLEWLAEHLDAGGECVVCGSRSEQIKDVVSHLEAQVNRVDGWSRALFENPVVDKEIEGSKKRLFDTESQLQQARTMRLKLHEGNGGASDSLSRVYVLLGRIESLLMSFAAMTNADATGQRIEELERELARLDKYFRDSDRSTREATVDRKLSGLIQKYANGFGLEQRGHIALDKNELTLSLKRTPDSKKEYLWEVGSGANWMGYHIATFLALHEFLSQDELQNSPVFGFLVIDQPSQVYFPSASSGANQLDSDEDALKKLRTERDVDIRATKRIFEMLQRGLAAAQHHYQVIVIEHADASIWGDLPSAVEAANWKAEGDGLIPRTWRR